MPESVVITRPLAQAEELAQRLRAVGRQVVVFPLLEIHALPDPAPLRAVLARLDEFALVAFVSPNAIDATFSFIQSWPDNVPLAVMGEGCRRALARHGVTAGRYQITSPIDRQRTDSQTLLEALDLTLLRERRVLILRGETGRELLADAMRTAGIVVEQVAAYRRVAPVMTELRAQQLATLLQMHNHWIITSSEALHILMKAVEQIDPQMGVAKMLQQKIFVPHYRIAETAKRLGLEQIFLTPAGDDGLLTALQSLR